MSQELTHHGRIAPITAQRTSELLETIRQRGLDIPSEQELFFFDAEISNSLLDSYFTHMSESTLRNYAQDAARGVAFLRGHNVHELPVGYSISGQLESAGEKLRVVAGFYTVRGLPETNDLILRMKSGLLRDVSVGFTGGQMNCDICGEEFWDCRHMPGLKYDEKSGNTVRTVLSTYTIYDARLSEVSGVFDGATPEAMVLKAQRAAKAGDLTLEQIELLEQRYRTTLPSVRSFAVSKPNIAPVVQKEPDVTSEELVTNLRSMLSVVTDEELVTGIEQMRSRLETATQRIKELEPQAADGSQYRADLVQEALAEGVRAQGDGFDHELYAQTLRSAPLQLVKRMRDDWKRLADALLPSGRTSVDQDRQVAKPVSVIPDEAYR